MDFVANHLEGKITWQDVINRVQPMTDYQMSWVPIVLPTMLNRNDLNQPVNAEVEAVNRQRLELINYLHGHPPYSLIFNSSEPSYGLPQPTRAEIKSAIARAMMDDNIPEHFRDAVLMGLNYSSWNFAATGLALVQAKLIGNIDPHQAEAIINRISGNDIYPGFLEAVRKKVLCDGKKPVIEHGDAPDGPHRGGPIGTPT